MKNGLIFFLIAGLSISGCAIVKGTDKTNHAAVCKELRYQMMWSGSSGAPMLWDGATGNQMQPTQQRAENDTLMRNYREQGCMDEQDDNTSTR